MSATLAAPAPAVRTVTRSTRGSRVAAVVLAGLVAVAAALPYLVRPSVTYSAVTLCILVILGSMWNLLAGYGGLVSIGQQAYIGLGAYGLVVLADRLGVDAFVAVPLAAVVAGLVALPISFLAFRLAGGYFAVGTWVIAELVKLLTVQVDALGGGSGISLRALAGTDRTLRIAYTYWWALATAVAAVLVVYLLLRSRLGLALTAVRDDPAAAAGLGVDVVRAKRVVFAVSAAGCGAAGALIALSTLRVQPESVFSVNWTAYMVFIVVIGGVGTIEGPILGAVVFFALQQWLAEYGSWYLVVLGLVAVAVTLAAPNGLWGLLGRRGRRGSVRLFPVGYTVRTGAP